MRDIELSSLIRQATVSGSTDILREKKFAFAEAFVKSKWNLAKNDPVTFDLIVRWEVWTWICKSRSAKRKSDRREAKLGPLVHLASIRRRRTALPEILEVQAPLKGKNRDEKAENWFLERCVNVSAFEQILWHDFQNNQAKRQKRSSIRARKGLNLPWVTTSHVFDFVPVNCVKSNAPLSSHVINLVREVFSNLRRLGRLDFEPGTKLSKLATLAFKILEEEHILYDVNPKLGLNALHERGDPPLSIVFPGCCISVKSKDYSRWEKVVALKERLYNRKQIWKTLSFQYMKTDDPLIQSKLTSMLFRVRIYLKEIDDDVLQMYIEDESLRQLGVLKRSVGRGSTIQRKLPDIVQYREHKELFEKLELALIAHTKPKVLQEETETSTGVESMEQRPVDESLDTGKDLAPTLKLDLKGMTFEQLVNCDNVSLFIQRRQMVPIRYIYSLLLLEDYPGIYLTLQPVQISSCERLREPRLKMCDEILLPFDETTTGFGTPRKVKAIEYRKKYGRLPCRPVPFDQPYLTSEGIRFSGDLFLLSVIASTCSMKLLSQEFRLVRRARKGLNPFPDTKSVLKWDQVLKSKHRFTSQNPKKQLSKSWISEREKASSKLLTGQSVTTMNEMIEDLNDLSMRSAYQSRESSSSGIFSQRLSFNYFSKETVTSLLNADPRNKLGQEESLCAQHLAFAAKRFFVSRFLDTSVEPPVFKSFAEHPNDVIEKFGSLYRLKRLLPFAVAFRIRTKSLVWNVGDYADWLRVMKGPLQFRELIYETCKVRFWCRLNESIRCGLEGQMIFHVTSKLISQRNQLLFKLIQMEASNLIPRLHETIRLVNKLISGTLAVLPQPQHEAFLALLGSSTKLRFLLKSSVPLPPIGIGASPRFLLLPLLWQFYLVKDVANAPIELKEFVYKVVSTSASGKPIPLQNILKKINKWYLTPDLLRTCDFYLHTIRKETTTKVAIRMSDIERAIIMTDPVLAISLAPFEDMVSLFTDQLKKYSQQLYFTKIDVPNQNSVAKLLRTLIKPQRIEIFSGILKKYLEESPVSVNAVFTSVMVYMDYAQDSKTTEKKQDSSAVGLDEVRLLSNADLLWLHCKKGLREFSNVRFKNDLISPLAIDLAWCKGKTFYEEIEDGTIGKSIKPLSIYAYLRFFEFDILQVLEATKDATAEVFKAEIEGRSTHFVRCLVTSMIKKRDEAGSGGLVWIGAFQQWLKEGILSLEYERSTSLITWKFLALATTEIEIKKTLGINSKRIDSFIKHSSLDQQSLAAIYRFLVLRMGKENSEASQAYLVFLEPLEKEYLTHLEHEFISKLDCPDFGLEGRSMRACFPNEERYPKLSQMPYLELLQSASTTALSRIVCVSNLLFLLIDAKFSSSHNELQKTKVKTSAFRGRRGISSNTTYRGSRNEDMSEDDTSSDELEKYDSVLPTERTVLMKFLESLALPSLKFDHNVWKLSRFSRSRGVPTPRDRVDKWIVWINGPEESLPSDVPGLPDQMSRLFRGSPTGCMSISWDKVDSIYKVNTINNVDEEAERRRVDQDLINFLFLNESSDSEDSPFDQLPHAQNNEAEDIPEEVLKRKDNELYNMYLRLISMARNYLKELFTESLARKIKIQINFVEGLEKEVDEQPLPSQLSQLQTLQIKCYLPLTEQKITSSSRLDYRNPQDQLQSAPRLRFKYPSWLPPTPPSSDLLSAMTSAKTLNPYLSNPTDTSRPQRAPRLLASRISQKLIYLSVLESDTPDDSSPSVVRSLGGLSAQEDYEQHWSIMLPDSSNAQSVDKSLGTWPRTAQTDIGKVLVSKEADAMDWNGTWSEDSSGQNNVPLCWARWVQIYAKHIDSLKSKQTHILRNKVKKAIAEFNSELQKLWKSSYQYNIKNDSILRALQDRRFEGTSGAHFLLTCYEFETYFQRMEISDYFYVLTVSPQKLMEVPIPKEAIPLQVNQILPNQSVAFTTLLLKLDEVESHLDLKTFDFTDLTHPYFRAIKWDKGARHEVPQMPSLINQMVKIEIEGSKLYGSWTSTSQYKKVLTKLQDSLGIMCRKEFESKDQNSKHKILWQRLHNFDLTADNKLTVSFTSMMSGVFTLCTKTSTPIAAIKFKALSFADIDRSVTYTNRANSNRVPLLFELTEPGYTMLDNEDQAKNYDSRLIFRSSHSTNPYLLIPSICFYKAAYSISRLCLRSPSTIDWCDGKGQLATHWVFHDIWGNAIMDLNTNQFSIKVDRQDVTASLMIQKQDHPNFYTLTIVFTSKATEDELNRSTIKVTLMIGSSVAMKAQVTVRPITFFDKVLSFRNACSTGVYSSTPLFVKRHDVIASIEQAPLSAVAAKSLIRFYGEKAIDAGGPTREFYDLFGAELLKGTCNTWLLREDLDSTGAQPGTGRNAKLFELESCIRRTDSGLYTKIGMIIANAFKYGLFIGTKANAFLHSALFDENLSDEMQQKIFSLCYTNRSDGIIPEQDKIKFLKVVAKCYEALRLGFKERMGKHYNQFISTFSKASVVYFLTGSLDPKPLTRESFLKQLHFSGLYLEANRNTFVQSVEYLDIESLPALMRSFTGSTSHDEARPNLQVRIRFVSRETSMGKDLLLHTCGMSMEIVDGLDRDQMHAVLAACSSSEDNYNIS